MAEVLGEVSPGEGRGVLSVAQAAAYLGVSVHTVYRWVERGRIPHVRIGGGLKGRIAIPRFSLDRWLDAEARRSVEAS